MFEPTDILRITNSRQIVRFRGFTAARFKTLHIGPAEALNAVDKAYSYTHLMNHSMVDLSNHAVQKALHQAIRYATAAASAAEDYFAKRPTILHPLSGMGKVFTRLFMNANPSEAQRSAAQAVFASTAAGLRNNITIGDLFEGADRFSQGSLTWGAEGQVAFDARTDQLYMDEMRKEGGLDRKNDIMQQFLSQANELEIYLDFGLIKTCNVFQVARVIVHEATHKFAFTGDYAYMSNATAFGNMSAADALKNADSYAYAAISVKEDSALTPEKIRRLGLPMVPSV